MNGAKAVKFRVECHLVDDVLIDLANLLGIECHREDDELGDAALLAPGEGERLVSEMKKLLGQLEEM